MNNKIVAIVVLIFLALVVILILKYLKDPFAKWVRRKPVFFTFLTIIFIGIMVFLVKYIFRSETVGFGDNNNYSGQGQETNETAKAVISLDPHTVLLSRDKIQIEDYEISLTELNDYLHEHSLNNVDVMIYDDYSSTTFVHQIIKMYIYT